jgi:hypothetical protein
MTQCGTVMTSAGGEATPGRGKGGHDLVGLTRILLGQKNEEKSKRSIPLVQMDGEDLKQR